MHKQTHTQAVCSTLYQAHMLSKQAEGLVGSLKGERVCHCLLSETDPEAHDCTVHNCGQAGLEGDIQLLLWQSAQWWKTHHGNRMTNQESRLSSANLASRKERSH